MPVSEYLLRWSSYEITECMAYEMRQHQKQEEAQAEAEKPKERVQTAEQQLAWIDSWE